MDEKLLGVEEIIKVLDVIIEGGNVAEDVSEADSIVGKLTALLPMTDEVLRLMTLSPMKLKAEFKDLEKNEIDDLKEHLVEKFDIKDDELEAKLEMGISLVEQAVTFVNKAADYAKSFRKG